MPLQLSGTVIALKCRVPPRVTVIVAVSDAAVAASGGWVAVDFTAETVTTFSWDRSLASAVWSSSAAPWVCAVVGSKPVTFSAQSLMPSPSVSASCTITR